ncbi:MAG: hypothetical protein IID38_06310 [Planctomycetes bacterium]|nr:hypothetical protein [Planctomycetota bacterium]
MVDATQNPSDQPVVGVLGCGLVTPYGAGAGIDLLSDDRPERCGQESPYWSVPEQVLAGAAELAAEVRRDRTSWMAGVALALACRDAGVVLSDSPPERVALVLGCALAGQLGMIDFADEVRAQSPRFVSPIHFPQTVGNYTAGVLSRAFKIRGPNLTLSTGASAGLQAVANACSLLRDGLADLAIAGGVEVLSEGMVRGLGGSQFGETNARVWSEGACIYLLSRSTDGFPKPVRATIVEWSGDAAEAGDGETFQAADLVGRSLAAESAMRIAMAIMAGGRKPGRAVVRCSEGDGACVLIVEVP